MTWALWVKCDRCGHERRHHGNETIPTSECHAVVEVTIDANTGEEDRARHGSRCDCPAFEFAEKEVRA